ncbi:MAG TPA: hypothetical protein VF658_12490 [Pyrinomonadaceae bacterium]|jgi:mRNA interferase MazF
MAITSQVKTLQAVGEVILSEWQQARLLKASIIKPVLTTVEKQLVLRQLGRLQQTNSAALRQALFLILG